jgi:hypothetical protein
MMRFLRDAARVGAWLMLAAGTMIIGSLGLTGCGAGPQPEGRIVIHTEATPLAASCVPANVGGKPAYTDTAEALTAAPDSAERFRLLAIGRQERDGRLSVLEPVVDACRKAGGQ